jgi:class 3 adenylate cyclase
MNPEPSASPSPAPAADGVPVILVVDDNEMNREMLSQFFQSQGYRVVTAEDGEQTLRLVGERTIDLVLLDIMMPEISGLQVLEKLRLSHGMGELPIIMATAKDRTEDVVEALNLGANDYVIKPLDLAVVLARVRTQLSLKRAMAEIRRLAQVLEIRNTFIRQIFGRYLSDEVVASLLETPGGLRLGGEKRRVSLLMSDLRGFTALAERMAPEQVLRLLNNYLAAMTEVIAVHQGTIDEFMGDGILALFGAPVAREDDAARACACAVDMQKAMDAVNERNRADGLPVVEMGVAVNTGEVIVGNIGSHTRAKYGVVGTHVNLTARLQSFTLGGQVLVSEATRQLTEGCLRVGETFNVHPKGFQGPITVHEVLGVGGRWKVFLPTRHEELFSLREEVRVELFTVVDQRSGVTPQVATLVKASERGALVRAAQPLPPLSSVRLRVFAADGGELPGEAYAKVVGETPTPDVFHIRFTSHSTEIARFLNEMARPA